MSTNVESNLSREELEQEGSSGTLPPSRTTQSCEESSFVKKRGEYKKRSKAWDHFHARSSSCNLQILHKGNEIGKAIEKCLLEWGVDDILTVTVDNASSNDLAIQYLRGKLQNWGKAVLGGKWTHMRWNSTYLMLDTSQRFEEQDPYMLQELENLPTKSDWTKARFLVIVLENFYQLTVKVFGSKYMTWNTFFTDISHIHGILIEMAASDNDVLSSMARSMKEKYDKYWGKIEKMNMLIFISSILDPRTKLEYLEFVVGQMYGEFDGATLAGLAKDAMFELFNEYKMLSTLASHSASSSLSSDSQRGKTTFHGDASKTITDRYKFEFKKRKMELGGRDAKSKLDIYLNEESEEDDERFDILL
ncbi:zinc finger BED domain-containing protein RICESLEEPER 4-like [Coffea eugenioides]|uniref:zinc finger BED domain-containing protein RICESLEEPER 4-like n=1 Tax=Coffea eugenioides TaxID=49369 RepID=UPI000F606A2D|nr:zinc finger BED domain-containing protein RICESLEEPER 4-like [Coffea eugenioides]